METTPQAPTSDSLLDAGGDLPGDSDFDDGFDLSILRATPVEPPVPVEGAAPSPAVVAGGDGQQPGVVPAPAVVTPPAAAPTPPAPAALVPAVTPAQPPALASAEAPQDLPTIERNYGEWRAGRVKQLADSFFKLDEATAQALADNPAEVVPSLMAQAHISAVEASVSAVANMLPAVIAKVTEQQRAYAEGESAFYTAWPALKDDRFALALRQTGQLFRQMNPTATKDEFIRTVGASVAAAFGVAAGAPQAQLPAPPAAPRAAPHTPLAAGGPRSVGAPPAQGNKFELMASELD